MSMSSKSFPSTTSVTTRFPDATVQLASYIAGISYEDLPEDVVHRVKLTLVDTLGVTLAAGASEFGQQIATNGRMLGTGDEATIFSRGHTASVSGAALVNGALSDVLEWQDGWRFGGLHPSLTIATALAVGETSRVDGRRLICAIIAGYEAANRVAASAHPNHMARGYMPNGTAGSIGSAACAGYLLGLDRHQMANAMGIAGFLLPVSTGENLWCGFSIKSFHTGYAARMGVEAALLANAGFDACPVEGSPERGRGFMEIMTGQEPDYSTMTRGLGETYTIRETYFKFYPACRLGHAAIEAALLLAKASKQSVNNITHIEVGLYRHAANLLNRYLEPGASMAAALYSLPYNIATALMDGEYGLDQLDEAHRNDPAVIELARRIKIVPDEAMTQRYPETTPASVTLTYRDGTQQRQHVEMPPGDPRRTTGDNAIFEKFDALVAPILGDRQTQAIRQSLMTIEDAADIRQLVREIRTSLN